MLLLSYLGLQQSCQTLFYQNKILGPWEDILVMFLGRKIWVAMVLKTRKLVVMFLELKILLLFWKAERLMMFFGFV